MAETTGSPRGGGAAEVCRPDVWPVTGNVPVTGGARRSGREALRRFGLVMAVPLAVLGGALLWKGRPAGPCLLAAAAVFAVLAVGAPRLLAPVERWWMAFARVLGTAMTYVVLTLTWVLLVTPIALVMRLAGKDPLALRRRRERPTRWVPVEPDGPCSRPDKPF